MKPAVPIAFAALLAGCGQAAPDFRALPGQGNFAMVVARGADPASFPALAKAKCGAAVRCSVFAWDDAASAATALPMTDREIKSEVFAYALNRDSGFERSLWNCTVTPRANREECL